MRRRCITSSPGPATGLGHLVGAQAVRGRRTRLVESHGTHTDTLAWVPRRARGGAGRDDEDGGGDDCSRGSAPRRAAGGGDPTRRWGGAMPRRRGALAGPHPPRGRRAGHGGLRAREPALARRACAGRARRRAQRRRRARIWSMPTGCWCSSSTRTRPARRCARRHGPARPGSGPDRRRGPAGFADGLLAWMRPRRRSRRRPDSGPR